MRQEAPRETRWLLRREVTERAQRLGSVEGGGGDRVRRWRVNGSSGGRAVLRACAFTMLSAELDYSIEIPDQACGIQGMERGLGPVVGGDLMSLWVASAAVAPPLRPRPLAARLLTGSRRSWSASGLVRPSLLSAPPPECSTCPSPAPSLCPLLLGPFLLSSVGVSRSMPSFLSL